MSLQHECDDCGSSQSVSCRCRICQEKEIKTASEEAHRIGFDEGYAEGKARAEVSD